MFQISNADDAKSEWNINETHIIIPMIDGDVINKESEKILTSSLTLNPLEAGDQTILANTLEHSFVIGLDKNIFENQNYKSDLVIIQNSDLKLLSCNNDLKNSVAYTLSYVDQDKSEILWQSSVQKDRTCASDKAILEVRDDLDYHDSVNELDKNEQINLTNIDSNISPHVSRNGDEILHEEIIIEEKNDKSQFINYLTVSQNAESVSNLQYLDESKSSENHESLDSKKLTECDFHIKPNKDSLNTVENTETNKTKPNNLVEFLKHKTDIKEKVVNKNKNPKDGKLEMGETYKRASESLPEKSLPLKKKAKMKKTLISYSSENQRSLLKQDMTVQSNTKSSTGRKTKQLLNSHEDDDPSHSDSDTPLIDKVKRNKVAKVKNISKEYDSVMHKNTSQKSKGEESTKIEMFGFDENKFSSIYDLVECLRKCRLINASIWQILNSGLKEMKVDILKEMNAKKNEKQESQESTNYSPQLKAFALVLYFKQPAAFNYLSQVYEAGWPSLKIIKDWKRRINSHQRPILQRTETNTENLKF